MPACQPRKGTVRQGITATIAQQFRTNKSASLVTTVHLARKHLLPVKWERLQMDHVIQRKKIVSSVPLVGTVTSVEWRHLLARVPLGK